MVKMAVNRMADVAALLGKKLGEEFTVDNRERSVKCRITENGLFFYHAAYSHWWTDSGLLIELLKGEVVIVDD